MTRFKEEISERDAKIKNLQEENRNMKTTLEILANPYSYRNGDGKAIPVAAHIIAYYGLHSHSFWEDAPVKPKRRTRSILAA